MKVHCKYDALVPWRELKPSPKNRNSHSEEQIERLAKLIRYQGVRAPIVVSNLSGCIVKGHGTLLAIAKLLKEDNSGVTAPVVYQDFEDEEQEYLFIQSDNSISAWSELDLGAINVDLAEFGPFDLDLLGIKDFVLDPSELDSEGGDGDADSVPEIPVTPFCRLGDLFILGNHRLLCGDSTDSEQVARLMNGEKADMVFTDPPYNVGSESSCFDASSETRTKSMSKLKDAECDKNFDPATVFSSFEFLMGNDCTIYWCTSHHLAPAIWSWQKVWATHSNYCVWSKPNPMPSLSMRHWTWNTELICYATKGKHVFNFPTGHHALSTWTITKSAKCDLHPTMKPVDVCEHGILHSSNSGQLVADLFLGSGTTIIACEKNNRRCYGMEISPSYCDVILDRFTKFSGKDPIREDGVKWSEIKSQSPDQ